MSKMSNFETVWVNKTALAAKQAMPAVYFSPSGQLHPNSCLRALIAERGPLLIGINHGWRQLHFKHDQKEGILAKPVVRKVITEFLVAYAPGQRTFTLAPSDIDGVDYVIDLVGEQVGEQQ